MYYRVNEVTIIKRSVEFLLVHYLQIKLGYQIAEPPCLFDVQNPSITLLSLRYIGCCWRLYGRTRHFFRHSIRRIIVGWYGQATRC